MSKKRWHIFPDDPNPKREVRTYDVTVLTTMHDTRTVRVQTNIPPTDREGWHGLVGGKAPTFDDDRLQETHFVGNRKVTKVVRVDQPTHQRRDNR